MFTKAKERGRWGRRSQKEGRMGGSTSEKGATGIIEVYKGDVAWIKLYFKRVSNLNQHRRVALSVTKKAETVSLLRSISY